MTKELMKKPEFNGELIVEIPEIQEVKHNLSELKTFTENLIKFYDKLVIDVNDDSQIDDLTKERTKVNNFLKQVANARKETMEKYKKPIDSYEKTSKEVEALLKGASEKMSDILNTWKEKKKEEKIKDTILPYINKKVSEAFLQGYLVDTNRLIYDEKWFNKTAKDKDIFNDIDEQFNTIIESIKQERKDLEILQTTMDSLGTENKELYIQQYNFTKDVQTVLSNVYAENKRKNEITLTENGAHIPNIMGKVLETENKIVVSFKGTVEQANKLKEYAKELGMEEI